MPHPNGAAHEMGDFFPPVRAQLEERYIVIKLRDVAMLTQQREDALYRILSDIRAIRIDRGADPSLPCIVVEKDWPEYEPTLATILARVDREATSAIGRTDDSQNREGGQQ